MGEIAEKVTSNLTKTWGRSISKSKNLVNMSMCIGIPNEVWSSGKKLKNSQLGRAGEGGEVRNLLVLIVLKKFILKPSSLPPVAGNLNYMRG